MLTRFPSILTFTCLWLLITTAKASALSVALFPLDDLSNTYNSSDQGMTDVLRLEVARQGLTVIPAARVEAFMATHRIRHLGALQGQDVVATASELNTDLVLLASLCQQSQSAAECTAQQAGRQRPTELCGGLTHEMQTGTQRCRMGDHLGAA